MFEELGKCCQLQVLEFWTYGKIEPTHNLPDSLIIFRTSLKLKGVLQNQKGLRKLEILEYVSTGDRLLASEFHLVRPALRLDRVPSGGFWVCWTFSRFSLSLKLYRIVVYLKIKTLSVVISVVWGFAEGAYACSSVSKGSYTSRRDLVTPSRTNSFCWLTGIGISCIASFENQHGPVKPAFPFMVVSRYSKACMQRHQGSQMPYAELLQHGIQRECGRYPRPLGRERVKFLWAHLTYSTAQLYSPNWDMCC